MSVDNIPVIILCGGEGTRMRGSTLTKKELVEIGGRPIIWHVMRIFSAQGFDRFVLALGYGAEQLKRYFLSYEALHRDFTMQLGRPEDGQESRVHYLGHPQHATWDVALIDTGPAETEKATRIARVAPYLDGDSFFVTYGDGVGDVDLKELVRFHKQHGKLATVTGVRVRFQYGTLEADDSGKITSARQKPLLPYWINAGFMLFNRPVLDLMVGGDDVHLERQVLPQLVEQGELMLYQHTGFWRSMDTLKDSVALEKLWQESAPWKMW